MAIINFEKLELRIGHKFIDKNLLISAITHKSFSNKNNERLEFLGDSLLNTIITTIIFDLFLDLNEGKLTQIRSNLVNKKALTSIAEELGLRSYIFLGKSEKKVSESILSNTVEAIIGAIFLDSNFKNTHHLVKNLFKKKISKIEPNETLKDSKTSLQEYLQSKKIKIPVYSLIKVTGPEHNQMFYVGCEVNKLNINISGSGRSKRLAEQNSAKKALDIIKKNEK